MCEPGAFFGDGEEFAGVECAVVGSLYDGGWFHLFLDDGADVWFCCVHGVIYASKGGLLGCVLRSAASAWLLISVGILLVSQVKVYLVVEVRLTRPNSNSRP